MAVDALDEMQGGSEERVVVVRFNPWWFSGQEDLTRAFFSEVSASLERRVSARVVDGLRAIARRVAGAGRLIGAGVAFSPGGTAYKDLAEAASAALGNLADEEKSLDAIRGELENALRDGVRRILVIIDDVDRLPDDEAMQIFRLVKSVADLPNVVHLLVFDREIARRATGGQPMADGPEWLEKIVQASFDLPIPHKVDLHRSFTTMLAAVVGPDPDVQPGRWPDVFHRAVAPWLRTPRDAARLTNAVAVAWPVVSDKVDLADFVVVEVLRLFEPRVYDVVRRSAPDLTGLGGDRDEQKLMAEQLLAASGEPRRADVRRALQLLFPRLERTWSNRSYGDGFMEGWDKARRICSAKRFTSYFTFTLDDDLLSASEREDIRKSVVDPDAFAAVVAAHSGRSRRSGGTRADLILDGMAYDHELLTDDLREAAARSLITVGDSFLGEHEPASFGVIPATWRVGFAVKALLAGLDPAGRTDLLVSAMAESPSLRTLSQLIVTVLAQHGTEDGEASSPGDERLVDVDGLTLVGEAFRARMTRESAGGRLAALPDLASVLYAWKRASGEDELRLWAADQLLTRNGLIALASGMTRTGVGGAIGSYAQLEFPTVDRGFLETFLDVDDFVSRVRDLRENASGPEAGIIDRFLRGLHVHDEPSD